VGGSASGRLVLVSEDPLNVGSPYALVPDSTLAGPFEDWSGHTQAAGLPFGSPFAPVIPGARGYFWISAAGDDFRLEPGSVDLGFYDGELVATAERVNEARRVDPASGRPLRADAPAGATCATGVEPDCWAPGDPLAQNTSLFAALCAWHGGLTLDGPSRCGPPLFNEPPSSAMFHLPS